MAEIFEIRTMSKKELRDYYGVSVFVWQARIKALPKSMKKLIPPTRALLFPAQVKALVEHWGEP